MSFLVSAVSFLVSAVSSLVSAVSFFGSAFVSVVALGLWPSPGLPSAFGQCEAPWPGNRGPAVGGPLRRALSGVGRLLALRGGRRRRGLGARGVRGRVGRGRRRRVRRGGRRAASGSAPSRSTSRCRPHRLLPSRGCGTRPTSCSASRRTPGAPSTRCRVPWLQGRTRPGRPRVLAAGRRTLSSRARRSARRPAATR